MQEIHQDLEIAADAGTAFEAFTDGLRNWWPPEYTWSGQSVLVDIGIEPGAGGMCFEIGPHGFRCDWGRVLVWDPPRRLVFHWQIGPGREPVPDPERASEVEVRFGDGRLQLTHRGFDRHGPSGGDYRKALASPEGWPEILGRFKAYLENQ
jgi:uncharacterized protein YndB with AHSA1/START domain